VANRSITENQTKIGAEMKTECEWMGKTNFVANINGFKVQMDAEQPFENGNSTLPKELVLGAFCGSTGVDVLGFLRRHNQVPDRFTIKAEAEASTGRPIELEKISLIYEISGLCNPERTTEAVSLSQTHYYPVGSQISQNASISYEVWLNGRSISRGSGNFRVENNRPLHSKKTGKIRSSVGASLMSSV